MAAGEVERLMSKAQKAGKEVCALTWIEMGKWD